MKTILEKEFTKVYKTVCSCTNKKQLEGAIIMMDLFFKKWDNTSSTYRNSVYIFWCGKLIGLVEGRSMEFDKDFKPNYD